MTKELPECPNLRNLKNRAKSIVKAHHRGESEICETLRILNKWAGLSDDEILHASVTLSDAQYALAMTYGFKSWRALRDRVESQGDLDETTVQDLVERHIKAYTTKGPSSYSIGSEYEKNISRIYDDIRAAGKEGMEADVRLSQPWPYSKIPRSIQRNLHRDCVRRFAQRAQDGDIEARKHLLRMMDDEHVDVQWLAVEWYGMLLHSAKPYCPIGDPSESICDNIAPILARTTHQHEKVREKALRAFGPFVHLENEQVHEALVRGLDDPVHKVHHCAADLLKTTCPTCGIVPGSDIIESEEWDRRLYERRNAKLAAGAKGLAVDVKLARSGDARDRRDAAINFALRTDVDCTEHLLQLMKDRSVGVRRQALQSYAVMIHPGRTEDRVYCLGSRTEVVPEGIERIIAFLHDVNPKNRATAVALLGDYATTKDHRIKRAIELAAKDPHERVQRSAHLLVK